MKKFETRIDGKVIDKILEASKNGLLFAYDSEIKDNTICDVCGKSEQRKIILSICKNRDQMDGDPMSGEVYIFGKTCYHKTFLLGTIDSLIGA